MMVLRWTRTAKNDLEALYKYYYSKSPQVAARMHNNVLDEAARLIRNPYMGMKVEELSTVRLQIRAIVILEGLYKLLYAADKNKIAIYRIWSCRQNTENLKV